MHVGLEGMIKTAEPVEAGDARASWNAPRFRKFQAKSAETGVNSDTDATATFS